MVSTVTPWEDQFSGEGIAGSGGNASGGVCITTAEFAVCCGELTITADLPVCGVVSMTTPERAGCVFVSTAGFAAGGKAGLVGAGCIHISLAADDVPVCGRLSIIVGVTAGCIQG